LSHFQIGLVALVGLVLVTYFGLTQRLPWQHDWTLHAVFRSANEIKHNSPVRIAGVNVGKVTGIGKGPGNTSIVSMAIEDKGQPLHADATLKIRPRIFLEGNFFVDVQPGSPSAPRLRDGATIPVTQTATPVQLDQVLDTLNRSTRGQLKIAVGAYGKALSGGGAQGLHDSFPYWDGAFKGVAQTAQAIQGAQPGDLRRFIRTAGQVSAALASRDQELGDLVTQFERTTGALAAEQSAVGATLRGLAAVTRSAGPSLHALDRAFPDVRAFVAEVRPGLRRAPKTLDLSLPLLRQLALLVRPTELPALAHDLGPTAQSLAAVEPQLATLLDKVTPVTDCVDNNALPTLQKTVPDGQHTTGKPVWQDLTDGMVGLASSSQDFDGNGPSVRYFAGFGDQLVSTGKVPGVAQAFGLAPSPLLGSRPQWPGPGNEPPFRPDVPCRTQDKPSLEASTAPAPPSDSASGVKASLLKPSEDVLKPLVRKIEEIGK
jgi:virulence factor Mce-like protein